MVDQKIDADTAAAATDLPATFRRHRPLIILALALLVFVPRLLDLDRFLNIDGSTNWLVRSTNFYSALGKGDLQATVQSSHPGVTVMILSGASMIVASLIKFGTASPWGHHTELIYAAKLPLALLTGIGTLLLGWLIDRRLHRPGFAVIAVVFIAVDPIFLGHSRFMHLDATAAILSLVSMLFIAGYVASRRRCDLFASAIFFALAILTRSTALAVAPLIVLWLFCSGYRRPDLRSSAVKEIAAWSLTATLIFFLLWPAMWVAPLGTAKRIVGGVDHALSKAPHDSGLPVAADRADAAPPAATVLRGKLLYDFVLFRYPLQLVLAGVGVVFLLRRVISSERDHVDVAIGVLAIFATAMLIGLSFFQKASSHPLGYRYALVCFLIAQLVAAYGVYRVYGSVRRLPFSRAKLIGAGLVTLICGFSTYQTLRLHPYYQVFHNGLMAGPMIGYGEGIELVADYLNQREHVAKIVVAADFASSLGYYFHGTTRWIEHGWDGDVDYVMLYNPSIRPRRDQGRLVEQYLQDSRRRPDYVAVVNGFELAWLFPADRSLRPPESLADQPTIPTHGRP